MSAFIAKNIHNDQAGFIPRGLGPDQIRRAVDIIYLRSQWDGGK